LLIYKNNVIIDASNMFIMDMGHSDYKLFRINGDLPQGKIMIEKEEPVAIRFNPPVEGDFIPKV
jgi:hypothetical protein